MKVAIAKNDNQVAEHFGYCLGFEIFEFNHGMVGNFEYIKNPGHRPGYLPNFLADMEVEVIIVDGMGDSAKAIFASKNIEVYSCVKGDILDVINMFSRNELVIDESKCEDKDQDGPHGDR